MSSPPEYRMTNPPIVPLICNSVVVRKITYTEYEKKKKLDVAESLQMIGDGKIILFIRLLTSKVCCVSHIDFFFCKRCAC